MIVIDIDKKTIGGSFKKKDLQSHFKEVEEVLYGNE